MNDCTQHPESADILSAAGDPNARPGRGRRLWEAWFTDGIQRLVLVLALVCAGLLVFNALTRAAPFGWDSMNYVDVARNIRGGRGITQSTLGYNQPRFPVAGDVPAPLTIQPPLYPLAIAAFTCVGLSAPTAALLVAALAWVALLVIAYALTAVLYDRPAALFAVVLLLIYDPLAAAAHLALTDTLALLFLLLGFLVMAQEFRNAVIRGRVVLAAGLCFGLAFATRYAMTPCLLVGVPALIVAFYLRGTCVRATVARTGALLLGFAVPAIPIVVRNFFLTGRVLGEPTLPLTLTPGTACTDVVCSLTDHYLGSYRLPAVVQELFLGTFLAGMVVALAYQQKIGPTLQRVFLARGSLILTLWVLVYPAFLVFARTRTYFDLDPRTVLPAGVVLAVLFAALASAVTGRTALGAIALILVSVALYREVRLALRPASPTIEQVVAQSERLTWIATQTTDRDLIAGVHTVDVPFYLGRSDAVCFLDLPYAENAEYQTLVAWVERDRSRYDRIFFVIPTYDLTIEAWQQKYGSFIADLVQGRTERYPNLQLHVRLADAVVFEVR